MHASEGLGGTAHGSGFDHREDRRGADGRASGPDDRRRLRRGRATVALLPARGDGGIRPAATGATGGGLAPVLFHRACLGAGGRASGLLPGGRGTDDGGAGVMVRRGDRRAGFRRRHGHVARMPRSASCPCLLGQPALGRLGSDLRRRRADEPEGHPCADARPAGLALDHRGRAEPEPDRLAGPAARKRADPWSCHRISGAGHRAAQPDRRFDPDLRLGGRLFGGAWLDVDLRAVAGQLRPRDGQFRYLFRAFRDDADVLPVARTHP